MPTISVTVPACNCDRTILETIESIQNPTFTGFELVATNDGSIDRTLELLKSVEDDHLKIVSYKNGRASVVRNHGAACATDKYLIFIDTNNLWAPKKLELQLAALQEHPEAGVAHSWMIFMQKTGSRSLHACEPVFYQKDVHAELLNNNFITSGSNTLMRNQVVSKGVTATNEARLCLLKAISIQPILLLKLDTYKTLAMFTFRRLLSPKGAEYLLKAAS